MPSKPVNRGWNDSATRAIFFESHQAVLCAPGKKAVLPDHHHFPSREIAELAGKEHKNVLPDIRLMLEGLGLSWADFSAQYKDAYGRMLPMFNLPKRETLILVSGCSIFPRQRHDHDQPRDCGTDW